MAGQKPARARVLRPLKLLAFQLLVAAIVLELLLRIYSPIPFRLKGDRIVLPTNQVYRFDNRGTTKLDLSVVHRKNSLGFRGPEVPRDFAQRLTVVTIGGSTTECLFLSDGKTWTDALGRLLEKARGDIWINNAGLDGHSTYGHLILVEDYIAKLKPKIAIFLIGTNDVGLTRSTTFDAAALAGSPSQLTRLQRVAVDRSAVASFGINLYRAVAAHRRGFGHSEVYPEKLPHLALDPPVVEAMLQQHRETYIPRFAERVQRIIELCRQYQIEPVLITQPALFGNTVDPATGVSLAEVQVSGRGNGESEWRLLELYNDVTRRIARAQHLLLIDLGREMPKDSRLFYDFLHFTNAGAQVAGEMIFRSLDPHLQEHYPPKAARAL